MLRFVLKKTTKKYIIYSHLHIKYCGNSILIQFKSEAYVVKFLKIFYTLAKKIYTQIYKLYFIFSDKDIVKCTFLVKTLLCIFLYQYQFLILGYKKANEFVMNVKHCKKNHVFALINFKISI